MCGIFGVFRKTHGGNPWSSNSNSVLKKIFISLTEQSKNRGSDSSGVALINKKNNMTKDTGEILVYKEQVSAEVFVKSPKFTELIKKIANNTYGLIGHTRSASKASTRFNQNNHPHICGKVVGVHNGYIKNWSQLARRFNLEMKGNCDSEIIFALINRFMEEHKLTLQEAVEQTSGLLEGSYACLAVSSRNLDQIAVFRCDCPVKIRHRTQGNVVMMASQNNYLQQAFIEAEWEKTYSPTYYEINEVVLPNKHGFILDVGINNYQGWVQNMKPFSL